jgi:DNA-directed RNA polymerase V subunit 1
MDDVDYLVEDNAMDDFCLSSKMDGTHDKPTFEDDLEQQLLRRQPMGEWHNGGCKLGTKCKCWE